MNALPFPAPSAPWLVRLLRFAILAFMFLSLLSLLLGAGALAFQIAIQDRIVPGIRVADIDLGGLTREEAAAALLERYQHREETRYAFHDGERSWSATARELGLSFPAEALVERAYSIGHGKDSRRSLREQAAAWFIGANLPATLEFDPSVARAFLGNLAAEIKRERRDASLWLDGLDARVDQGATGRKLNIDATLLTLSAAILSENIEREIALVIDESPPRLWNVAEAAAKIETALSTPIHLLGADRNGALLTPWIISQQQIRAALEVTLHADGERRRYEVGLDLSALERYLATLSPALSKPAVDGRFDFDPQTGNLTALSPSAAGRQLNVEETIARLEAAIFDSVNRRVAMGFEPLTPRFHEGLTAAELGITELVSEATTYYWGSWPNRRSNIALGAGKLNGIIIAPGEEFSFNDHLGDITPEAGYLEGSVILGGATVTGIGGGICQVSTTMYRAAFGGGYAITERNSHGYRVGYYEYANAGPGLDAAIWQPEIDLRFQNNTPYHLLIESSFLGAKDALQFRIYSTRHWRTVIENAVISDIVPAPAEKYVEAEDLYSGQIRQIDYAADGADVWVYRNVYDRAGNLVKRDQVFTRYQPWQAVFEVAPGDPRLEVEEEDEGEAADSN
ncbi:MAG: VanW family protein [Chloroflexota bacterium]|nr:VanW family protein [Chloroflexota bacterium]MDE2909843.1 VanW family protein [Chloroflexota bacterium]